MVQSSAVVRASQRMLFVESVHIRYIYAIAVAGCGNGGISSRNMRSI